MRRMFGVLGAGAAVAIVFAFAGDGSDLIANYSKALSSAKSLNATYTVQPIGGVKQEYSVTLGKPNLARLETPTQLIVADGTNVTTLDKSANTYFKKPQSDADLKGLFATDETNLWAGFFGVNGFSRAISTKSSGAVNRKGMAMNGVEISFDKDGKKVETLFLGKDDNVAHQATIVTNDASVRDTIVLDTKTLTVSDTAPSVDQFSFKAPDGARELSLAEMNSAKWYTDWAEASKAAAASHRLVLVDFYTDWCHWCKVLDREVYPTDQFKAESKYYVFCRINAEVDTAFAGQFNITGYPTIKFLKADGTQVGEVVGYKPVEPFVADMEKFRQGNLK